MPFVFTGSATLAETGTALMATTVTEAGPADSAMVFGPAVETVAVKTMESHFGMVAETYHPGGRHVDALRAGLSPAGEAAGALAFARQNRNASILTGAALPAATACTRFGVFHSGLASPDDPKYTRRPAAGTAAEDRGQQGCLRGGNGVASLRKPRMPTRRVISGKPLTSPAAFPGESPEQTNERAPAARPARVQGNLKGLGDYEGKPMSDLEKEFVGLLSPENRSWFQKQSSKTQGDVVREWQSRTAGPQVRASSMMGTPEDAANQAIEDHRS